MSDEIILKDILVRKLPFSGRNGMVVHDLGHRFPWTGHTRARPFTGGFIAVGKTPLVLFLP